MTAPGPRCAKAIPGALPATYKRSPTGRKGARGRQRRSLPPRPAAKVIPEFFSYRGITPKNAIRWLLARGKAAPRPFRLGEQRYHKCFANMSGGERS